MNTDYLLLLLLFPLAWPFIAKRIWSTTINWAEMGLQIAIPTVLIIIIYLIGGYGATADVEIRNGHVTNKDMRNGQYTRTYQCRCRESCSGSGDSRSCHQVCDTCYEEHYTRSYNGYTSVGNFTFDSIDSTSRTRRNNFGPPASYTKCVVGEPASREHNYTNYIQAVPESIFNFGQGSTLETFADLIPEYPRVYRFYRINRVLTPGVTVPDAARINLRLNETLRALGPSKQANIVLVIVNTPDQTYRHALEEAWLGGEKNDVVVIIGAPNYPKIAWADIMTLGSNAGNSLMTVTMRDSIMEVGSLENGIVVADIITDTIKDKFDRKAMADYEYLKDEIDPPLWAVIIALVLGIGGSLGLTVLFHHKDFFENRYRRY